MTYDQALLQKTLAPLGIAPDDATLAQLEHFAAFLLERNQTLNLTALVSPDDIAVKHFADSLSALPFLPQTPGARVLDLGTGGGFPGIPLLIARPDLRLTLMDSTRKKLVFVEEALQILGLSASVRHARAEEAGQDSALRAQFDFCVSRAVAELRVLAEYCLPFVAVGGHFLAMKGANADAEIQAAKQSLRLLGGEIAEIRRFSLGEAGERTLILVKKLSQSPTKYPRPAAQIAKAAL